MQRILVKDILERFFFPVEQRILFWAEEKKDKEYNNNYPINIVKSDLKGVRQDNREFTGHMYQCPRNFALVNLESGLVYRCVTDGYCVITNKEAVELADIAAKNIFKLDSIYDFEHVYPRQSLTGSRFFAEFCSSERFFDGIEDDIWCPSLIVANSYNSTVALTIRVAYHIISDDKVFVMLDGDEILSFKESHGTRYQHLEKVLSEKTKGMDVNVIREIFLQKMKKLKRIYVDEKEILPLMLKLMNASFSIKRKDDNLPKWIDLALNVEKYIPIVFKKNNGYYFLKTMAYVLSNSDNIDILDDLQFSAMLRNQENAGKMINELIISSDEGNDISDYVGRENIERAEYLRKLSLQYNRVY